MPDCRRPALLPEGAAAGGGGGGGLPGLSTPGGRVTLSAGRGVTLTAEPSALIESGGRIGSDCADGASGRREAGLDG